MSVITGIPKVLKEKYQIRVAAETTCWTEVIITETTVLKLTATKRQKLCG